MKESIGGGWLFGIVIVFIFLFSGFLAYSVSYTRAFNLKNEVINYIEHNEGFSKYPENNLENAPTNKLEKYTEGKIYLLVKNMGYDYSTSVGNRCKTNNLFSGVCIEKICQKKSDGNYDDKSNVHYKVTAYMKFQIPVIGIGFTIPISGETRSIYTDNNNFECSGS